MFKELEGNCSPHNCITSVVLCSETGRVDPHFLSCNMKLILRYSLELLVSFFLVQFFHSTKWFSPDDLSNMISNRPLIKLDRSEQSNLSFNTVMEPYDTSKYLNFGCS